MGRDEPMDRARPLDVTRVTLQVLAIGTLIVSSFWILRPFLVAFTWATTIVISTWPVLLGVQRVLGGRRALAVTVMTAALILILVLPLFFSITTILENADRIEEWAKAVATKSRTERAVPLEITKSDGTSCAAISDIARM